MFYLLISANINPYYWGINIPFKNDYVVCNLKVETTNIKEIKHKEHHLYNELDDTQKVIYNALLSQSIDILEGKENTLSVYLTLEELGFKADIKDYKDLQYQWRKYFDTKLNSAIIRALSYDYNYYTWWYGGIYYFQSDVVVPMITNGDYSKSIVEVKICSNSSNNSYYITDSVLLPVLEAFRNAEDVANSVQELSQLDKMSYFRDYLINTSEYDDEAYEYDTSHEDLSTYDYKKYAYSHSFINMFDNNPDTKVVCDGYAKSFLLLCDLAGIDDVYYVDGYELASDGDGGNHAWNKYYDEDGVYLIDITFYRGNIDSYLAKIDDQSSYTIKGYSMEYTYTEGVHVS